MKKLSDILKAKIYPLCGFLLLTVLIACWNSTAPVESAKQNNETPQIENYDIRTDKSEAAQTALKKYTVESGANVLTIADRKTDLRKAIEDAEKSTNRKLEFNEISLTPEIIAAQIGSESKFPTAPGKEKRVDTLRAFLNENSALLGLDEAQISALETTADYTNPNGILSFVNLAQKINGVPVFSGEVKAGFTKRGEIFRIVNNLAPALNYQNLNGDFGSAETAVSNAAKYININSLETPLKRNDGASDDLKITFERGQFADEITAEKFYFPVRFGAARAAWRVLFWTKSEAFYVVVDALDGTLLWRKNISENQSLPASFTVYGNQTSMMKTADNPTAYTPGCDNPNNCPQPPLISRQTFTLVGNEAPYTFNNLGWIPDAGLPVRNPADPNVTDGNAVEAGIDRDGTNGVDAPVPGSPFRTFDFAYNPFPGNPPPGEDPLLPTFQKGSVTQVFYTVNRWHDEAYLLGFNEQAGNFQHFNFSRGGVEGDRISAEVQDSSGTNNINFATPADGTRPRLQTFILTGTTPNRDGGLDAQSIVHELSHGISSRLFGNGTGLLSNMSRAMSEGWSDFYALTLLSEPSDDSCGKYAMGGYFIVGISSSPAYYYGLRRFPTARRQCTGPNGKPHSPLTFRYANATCNADIDTVGAYPRGQMFSTGCDQVHNLSELWSLALWETRGVLITQHGAVEGNRRILQYMTDAMKISPLNPTFIQGRDAIIATANAINPTDVGLIREGFRRRGMGFSASIQNVGTGANNTVVTESFDNPNVQIIDPFTVSDSTGDNDGRIEVGENVLLSVTFTNQTGQTANNVVVNINNNSATNFNVGTINSGQTVKVQIPYQIPFTVCSPYYDITFNGTSSLGVLQSTSKVIRIDTFIFSREFSNSTPIDLPAGQPTITNGISGPYPSNITVSGASSATGIKVKLNGFHHSYEGDVDFLLVGPGGQKFILMSDVGGNTNQLTPITFSIGDDGNNLLPSATAILNGQTYKPANHVPTDSFPMPAPAPPYEHAAPTGSATFASAFGSSGSALNGTWSLYAVDDANGDAGRVDGGWTLIFETIFLPLCTPAPRARADFDGDGRTDMSVFRPSEGNWYLNRSTAGFNIFNWGLNGDDLVPGDYDGDGRTDPAIRRGGDWYVWKSSQNTFSVVNWGLASDIAVAGDYDNDMKTDFAVFRPSEGNWYVIRSIDNGIVIYNWGLSGDKPIAADYDGDGKTDFAVYRNGIWYINTSGSGIRTVSFGLSSDMPVAADYDGDGRDDIAVFRPSDGVWYVWQSASSNISYTQFGLNGDVPVPGDYDGDNRDDQAVYRNGVWYLNRSGAGFTATQFGLANDKPIPKAYIP